ncbi:MAG: PLP-dependent transferase, partial [bacterium]
MLDLKPDSLLAKAGDFVDKTTGAVVPPIHPATTFCRNADYELIGDYIYSRYQNPTYDQVEAVVAEVENGREARVFASGMAAIAAVFEIVQSGQHIVAPTIMYHGAQDWLRHISAKRNIGLTLFDAKDPDALRQAIQPGKTAIVWIETPVNPTWD